MTGSYQGGYYPSNMGGGGGSGYIQYHTQILNNNTLINVTVGDHRQVSVVTINGEVIEAAAGQDSHGGSSNGDGSILCTYYLELSSSTSHPDIPHCGTCKYVGGHKQGSQMRWAERP